MNQFQQTGHGFNWGAAKVTRCFSDEEKQSVTLRIETPKHDLQIYVTKTGRVRVHDKGQEWRHAENAQKMVS